MKTSLIILSFTMLVLTPSWASDPYKPYKGPVAKYKTIKPSEMTLPKSAQWAKDKSLWDPKSQQKLRNYLVQQGQQRQQYFQNSKALTERLNKMKFTTPKSNMPRVSSPTSKPNPMVPTQQQMFDNSMKYLQQSVQKQQQTTKSYTPPAHGDGGAGSITGNRAAPTSGNYSGTSVGNIPGGVASPGGPEAPPAFIQPSNGLTAPTIEGSPAFIQPDIGLAPPPGAIEGTPAFIEPTTNVLPPPGEILGGNIEMEGPFFTPMDVSQPELETPQWSDGLSNTVTNSAGAGLDIDTAGFFAPTADTGIAAPQWGGTNSDMDSAQFATQSSVATFGVPSMTGSFGTSPQTVDVDLTNETLNDMKKAADNANQTIFENIHLAKMKQLKAQAKAETEASEQRVQEVESIAGLLDGYESPKQTDPSRLGIEIESINPNEGYIKAPAIAGADGGGGNVAAGPIPAGQHFSQTQGVKMNEEGMVWSEDYGDWVSPDILEMDQKIKDDFQAHKDESAREREAAWRQYWEENGDPTFDEELQKIFDELKDAKQKVQNSDVASKYADYVEKYNDQHGMLSPEQMKHLREQLQNAVDRGASGEDLKNLAKKYVALGMEEQKAIAAEAEEDEAAAELGIEMSKGTAQALGSAASGGMGFLAGKLVEGGTAFAVGYAEKGFWNGVEQAFSETLPVNTALILNKMRQGEKVTYTELVTGLIGDVASSFDVAEGLGGALKGAGAVDDMADAAAKVNKNYDMDSLINDLDLEKQNKRNTAYFAGRQEGYDAVEKFQQAAKMGDKKAMKELAVEIQGDKHAMRAIQEKPQDLWKDFNGQIDDIYEAADDKAVKLAKQQIAPKDLGYDVDEIVDFEVVKVTNPSSEIKVSYDRDWTLRAKVKTKDGSFKTIDVPPKHSTDLYNASYYEAAKGVPPPNREAAKAFAHEQDQVVTYARSSDAYGSGYEDFDVAFNNKGGKFTDPEQVGQAMAYKSNEWYREADKLNLQADQCEKAAAMARKTGDMQKAAQFEQQALQYAGQAEAATEEGMRQFTKQYDKQLVQRFEAVGLSEADLPPRLIAAKEILNRVGTGPNQGFTPAQAQSALKVFGYNSVEEVGAEMGKCLEALQKFKIK